MLPILVNNVKQSIFKCWNRTILYKDAPSGISFKQVGYKPHQKKH